MSSIDEADVNLAVIEMERSDSGRIRREWYFGTFHDKPLGECAGQEVEDFYRKLDDIFTRKSRIAGRDLDAALSEAAERAMGMDEDHWA